MENDEHGGFKEYLIKYLGDATTRALGARRRSCAEAARLTRRPAQAYPSPASYAWLAVIPCHWETQGLMSFIFSETPLSDGYL